MRIELPEPGVSTTYFEFVGGTFTRHTKFSHWRSETDTELIARLDRWEVLEIGNSQQEYEDQITDRLRRQFGIESEWLHEGRKPGDLTSAGWTEKGAVKPQTMVDWSQDAGPQESLSEYPSTRKFPRPLTYIQHREAEKQAWANHG